MRGIGFICLIALFMLTGCSGKRVVYHAYQHIPGEWGRGDTLLFDISIPDSAQNYRTVLLVRNRDSYKYQNLVVKVETNFPDSMVWRADTFHLDLTGKTGKWELSNWRGLRETVRQMEEQPVPASRTFRFKVSHLMGEESESLKGINDVGILIER